MGCTAMFQRLNEEQFKVVRKTKKLLEETDGEWYLGKRFTLLELYLTENYKKPEEYLLHKIFFTLEEIVVYEDEYHTEYIFYSTPSQVKATHEVLEKLDLDDIVVRFFDWNIDLKEMTHFWEIDM
ncbi:MAG: DUF1877 family protein, partial [Chitinophagales bacterium]